MSHHVYLLHFDLLLPFLFFIIFINCPWLYFISDEKKKKEDEIRDYIQNVLQLKTMAVTPLAEMCSASSARS